MQTIILLSVLMYSFCLNNEQKLDNHYYSGKVSYKIINYDSPSVIEANLNNAVKKVEEHKEKYTETIKGVEKYRGMLNFELYFNQSESIFGHEDILVEDDLNERMQHDIALITSTGGYTYYKNLQDKLKVNQINKSGQLLNVQQDFDLLDWEITTEQKIIGVYTCIKAVASQEVLDRNNELKIKRYTAWFTPEIPVPFGPCGIDGLPGLVLEASKNKRFFFYAQKIEIGKDVLDETKIKLLKGGKDITEDKWQEINRKEYQRIKNKD